MAFLTVVASLRFPTTNNQLRTSFNPRNQATIQDGRVSVQQVQGRQGKNYSGTTYKNNATSSRGNNTPGQARVVKCYNYQGEGHMARQCTQPKRPRNAAWYKEKAMLAEAQETEDLDTYDSDYDDLSNAHAVLMANISNYGSDVISEVPNSNTYLNDMDNQSVLALQDFEQSPVMDFTDNAISSDSNIIPYSQYLQETQQATVQDTNLQAQQDSMILSVIEQIYKERVKTFEQRLNIDLSSREKMIDSQMDDMIREKLALKEQIDSLEQNISKQIKEKESVLQTLAVFKNGSKEKKNKYMENEIDLENKIKELDNIICKVGQSAQTVHMLTKPQAFYDNIHKQALDYQNPFYLKKAQRVKPTLYDEVVISNTHVAMPVIDGEETLILEEESRSKMFEKAKDPEVVAKKISHKPIDYGNLNGLIDDFGKLVKKRTTPSALEEDLLNEITEVQTIFDQMEASVQQFSIDKKCLEIAKKEILLENDQLLQKIMSQDVMLTVMNSMSLNKDSVNMNLQKLSDDFGKRFTPQQELSVEQAFWLRMSNPTNKSSDASPVKIEAPKELPKVSLVNESLKKLIFHLARFNNVVKIRTTPDACTEGEWGFEHTKVIFNKEIIPFLKSLKDIFNVFYKDLLNEIMEVQTVFNQIDAAIQQPSVNKQFLEIAKKELLLENDLMLQQIMSQDVLLTVMNSMSLIGESVNMDRKRNESCNKCFNLKAEHLKSQNAHNDLLKRNNTEDIVNYDRCELETINEELENSVAKLLSENKLLCKEINHVKQVFKDQFDSIKKTRVRTKEQSDSLIDKLNLKSAENEDLKAQIQDKVFVITSLKNDLRKLKGKEIVDSAAQIPTAITIVPGMFKLDLDPLSPKLLQNRDAHIDYLKHTQEQADIL
ncbi:reverse transcriptase domain-containing protein [Tanacetum coccineum]